MPVVSGQAVAAQPAAGQPARGDFAFVQISDTHIGFKGEANPDVIATLHLAIAKINALQPADTDAQGQTQEQSESTLLGLETLRLRFCERVEQLGGMFNVRSSPGHGTTVIACLPC